ncbi:MAG: cytochrome P450 [Steroidobacteraceae bacterium]
MTESSERAAVDSSRNGAFQYDADVMFGHPDDTTEIDAYEDPVREIAARLHAHGPVVRGHGLITKTGAAAVQFMGITFPNILTPPSYCEQDCFCAVSWEAVRAVYMNPGVFSSTVFQESVGAFWGPALSPMDPPEHTKYRAIMQLGFTPKRIASYEQRIINPVITDRFNAIKYRGKADLVRELNGFYPFEIVGAIVGFDASKVAFVGACFNRIWHANVDPQGAHAAGTALRAYSKELIDSRRLQPPKDDLVSAMMEAEVDGQKLSEERFVAMINHFMAGGIDTTYGQSGNLVHNLLTHPDQFEALKRDRSLIPAAVEESLRYEGIGGILCRRALADTDLCGTAIPKGSVVFLMHGVTDRDRSRWEDPDIFNVRRPRQPHIQFANGPHSCIGQHLARFMLARYVEHLIDDLPNLRWDPTLETPPKITGWTQRHPLRLPVVWDV